MQIEFTPHKIRAAKAYLKTLGNEEEPKEPQDASSSPQKPKKPSFFQRLFTFLLK